MPTLKPGASARRARKTLKVTGTVLEQVDGPPYSYLRLQDGVGGGRAMVPTARVGTNQRVTVVEGVVLRDFDTGVPGHRFDVVFGALER